MTNSRVNFLVKIQIRCWDINKTRKGITFICRTLYIIFESRLSVCGLSPPKPRDVRRWNFTCGCMPCVCRTWARSYVDRGHRWEEIKILKHCAYTCCSESHAAASFDFDRVAGVRRMPATRSKVATPRYIHTAAPGRSEPGQSNRRRVTEAGMSERIRSNARHADRGAQRRE